MRCPECDDDVNVGTAGPANLIQHIGRKKCEKTKLRKKLKYNVNVTTTAHCTECDEEVKVGTAGHANLAQHKSKSKCRKTKEKKEKLERKGKMRTLFKFDVETKNVKLKVEVKDATDSITAGPA
jgi:hypothetical protein